MQNSTIMDFIKSEIWNIQSSMEQQIWKKINNAGTRLKDLEVSINFGIKTGLNEAFIIDSAKREELLSNDPKSAEIIRPILRGRDVRRYGYEFADLWLIATFPSKDIDIDSYPAVRDYLLSFGKERLEQTGRTHYVDGEKIKSRKKTNNKWFETQDSISYWDEFSKQKIVWARLMRISKTACDDFPRFAVIDEDYVVQDSLCFITGYRLPVLCAILNSDLAIYYYFSQIASLDEGGLQMRQQYIELFPIPEIDEITEIKINQLLESSQGPNTPEIRGEIDQLVFALYHISDAEIEFIRNYNLSRISSIQKR